MSNQAGRIALSYIGKSIGWACASYTIVQLMTGQLHGRQLLGWIAGALAYGVGMFALDHWKSRTATEQL